MPTDPAFHADFAAFFNDDPSGRLHHARLRTWHVS
jgi:hypothetical protein